MAGEHAAHLVVFSLAQKEAGGALSGDFQTGGQAGLGFAPQEQGSRGKAGRESGREGGRDRDFVGFFHFVPGGG